MFLTDVPRVIRSTRKEEMGERSIPVAGNFFLSDSIRVVPLPMKGSKTLKPDFVTAFRDCLTKVGENLAGYP